MAINAIQIWLKRCYRPDIHAPGGGVGVDLAYFYTGTSGVLFELGILKVCNFAGKQPLFGSQIFSCLRLCPKL